MGKFFIAFGMKGINYEANLDGVESQPMEEQNKLMSKARTLWRVVKRGLQHALFPMLVLVVFSLIVKENYPFSNFPMYSKMSPSTEYYILEDGEGQALPVKNCFGLSASALKKMYVKRLDKLAVKRSEEKGYQMRRPKLSLEDQGAAGEDLLDYLLPRGDKIVWWKKNRPDVIRVVRVVIEREDDRGLIETPTVLVERRLN